MFQVVLAGMCCSVVCKNTKLDEDEIEDDEVSPELDDHQIWVYDGLGTSQPHDNVSRSIC